MKIKYHLALPVLNEFKNLPVLLDNLSRFDTGIFTLWVCVNNYEHWRDLPQKQEQVTDNEKSLTLLKSFSDIEIRIIDKASRGKGWPQKKGGVGQARKTIMDAIAGEASDTDIIVSTDADTTYPVDYLTAIEDAFQNHPHAYGLAVPYFHRLGTNDEHNRLILRYEIYMRNYALNMLRINNPYAFSALGSAMAFPVWAYKKVGGLTPVMSGEDFYFLQKLTKTGNVIFWADAVVKPSSRLSDRVIFGTGPALIKGKSGDWNSYPIYHHSIFETVKQTFNTFSRLFNKNLPTPMDNFLKQQFNNQKIWDPLRKNYTDRNNFVRACNNKVDGLRILQYLRKIQGDMTLDNNKNLIDFLFTFYAGKLDNSFKKHLKNFDFDGSAVCFLDLVREFMFEQENILRKAHDSLIS